MRFRQALPMVGILCVVPSMYFLFPRKPDTDSIGDFESWAPSPTEIANAVGPGRGGRFDDARHVEFAQLFQQRFRGHSLAVGLKFMDSHTLKAMFAPTIPRWDMARVAVQAEGEARKVFGENLNVDIYETYITAPMRKLAEVRRATPDGPVQVRFDPRFAIEQFRQRRAKEAALGISPPPPPRLTRPIAVPFTPMGPTRAVTR